MTFAGVKCAAKLIQVTVDFKFKIYHQNYFFLLKYIQTN